MFQTLLRRMAAEGQFRDWRSVPKVCAPPFLKSALLSYLCTLLTRFEIRDQYQFRDVRFRVLGQTMARVLICPVLYILEPLADYHSKEGIKWLPCRLNHTWLDIMGPHKNSHGGKDQRENCSLNLYRENQRLDLNFLKGAEVNLTIEVGYL